MEWLRLHTSILNNRKVDSLPGDLYKTWVKLLAVAADFGQDGALPSLNDAAYQMRMPEDVLVDHINRLKGLVDTGEGDDGAVYSMHDWEQWQFVNGERPTKASTSSERVRRYRARLAALGAKPNDAGRYRDIVYERDGHRCVYCGADDTLCLDHVTPVSRGGVTDDTNLVTACKSCNSKKAGRSLAEARMSFVTGMTPEGVIVTPSVSPTMTPMTPKRDTGSRVRDRAHVRSDTETESETDSEIGGVKTSNSVTPTPMQIEPANAAEIRRLMFDFVRQRGETADWPEPDAGIVRQVATILNGSGVEGLVEFLNRCERQRKYPHQSYAWFIPLLQEWKAWKSKQLTPTPTPTKPTWKCPRCIDTGRTFNGAPPGNGAELEAASFCDCAAGRRRAIDERIATMNAPLVPTPTERISEFLPKSAKSNRGIDK